MFVLNTISTLKNAADKDREMCEAHHDTKDPTPRYDKDGKIYLYKYRALAFVENGEKIAYGSGIFYVSAQAQPGLKSTDAELYG